MTHGADTFENFLRHPISWVTGGVVSAVGVLFSIGLDPISAVSAVMAVFSSQAMNLFTAFSIAGFTIGDFFDWLPADLLQTVAVFFGVIVVVKLLDSVWDSIKDRLGDK